ncbi:MAG: polysaccharide pyruvyl transferase family protein [Hyphomicrobiaceae bacterium]
MKRPIKMFWSGGRNGWVNYGDCIGPALVELLASRPVVYAGIHGCELLAAGSLLERYAGNRWRRAVALNLSRPLIWGTGSMHSGTAQSLGPAKVVSVRGRRTIAKYGMPAETPIGDPGVLAHLLLRRADVPKSARWGIIPHLNDLADNAVRQLLERTPAARLIDLSNPDIHAVTEEIAGCEHIASSSLHGLIAADSLEIPSFRLVVSDRVVGGDWKFDDYASSVGDRRLMTRRLDPSLDLREMERRLDFSYGGQVDDLKDSVLNAFRQLNL